MKQKYSKIEVTCATCGKPMLITENKFKNQKTGKFYCSLAHSYEGRLDGKHYLYNRIEVECSYCGKPKLVAPSYFHSRKMFFCSIDHQMKWRSENWKGKNCPLYGERIKVYCAICGKEKLVIPSVFEKSKIFFCGQEHQGLWKSIHQNGKNCGRWNGGCQENYPSEFNSILRRRIRIRDSYSCQLCGRTEKESGSQHAIHHIDYNPLNNQDMNLVSLCHKGGCHSKTNSNREYWQSFLKKVMEERFNYTY